MKLLLPNVIVLHSPQEKHKFQTAEQTLQHCKNFLNEILHFGQHFQIPTIDTPIVLPFIAPNLCKQGIDLELQRWNEHKKMMTKKPCLIHYADAAGLEALPARIVQESQ